MPQIPAYIHAAILPADIQGVSHRGLRDADVRDLIPGATLRIVDGAGHLVQYDAGIALANELRSWLAAQTQRVGPPS
jgi:pimeloyl-ACP methyl ester carboxylesterase